MKIPLIPIHIMTENTLNSKIKTAEDAQRSLTQHELEWLLNDNITMAKMLTESKSRRRKKA